MCERFIPVLLLLCVALQLCLVPQLLNLTIKQRCKNRMFLAKAQQRQSGEGGNDHTLSRKKKFKLHDAKRKGLKHIFIKNFLRLKPLNYTL